MANFSFAELYNVGDKLGNLSPEINYASIIKINNIYLQSTIIGLERFDNIINFVKEHAQLIFQHVHCIRLTGDSFLLLYSSKYEHSKKLMQSLIKKTVKYALSDKAQPFQLILQCGISSIENRDLLDSAIYNALISLNYAEYFGKSSVIEYSNVKDKLQEYKDEDEMATYFLSAYRDRRLALVFQPVVDAKTCKTSSFEALLRICTRDGDIISAGSFILVAEKLGFIHHIDRYVLKKVAKKLLENEHLHLAVNISSVTMENTEWLKTAKKLFKGNNIASRLTVELTETAIPKDSGLILKFINKVKTLGCKIAIDDFGSGNTSFKQLKKAQADILKIDGVFIKDINHNPDSLLFVETLLKFAKAHNLKTVAEFVETAEIAKTLMNLGVDCMQGYYFGRATDNINIDNN